MTLTSIIIFAVASLFQTIEWPSYDALVADFSSSRDRERAYSLSYMGSNLGLVLAPTIGGLLFNEHLNLAFLINGLSIAMSTALIFFLIKDTRREKDEEGGGVYEKELEGDVSAFSIIRQSRVVILFILASALSQGVYSMYSGCVPRTLHQRLMMLMMVSTLSSVPSRPLSRPR